MASTAPEKITSPTSPETRIITHLNIDHQRSLSHYLRHYARVSALSARSPLLTSISFDKMTIRTRAGKDYSIPIIPPMTTWADARARAVAMDGEARSALGIEDVFVDRYIPPTGFLERVVFWGSALNLVQCVVYLLGGLNKSSWVHDKVLNQWPWGGAEGYLGVLRTILGPVVVVHAVEAVIFDRIRMKGGRFGVLRGEGLWWKWVGGQFLEGVGNFWRFDREVGRLRKEKEGKKH